jgi:hypothetical protein
MNRVQLRKKTVLYVNLMNNETYDLILDVGVTLKNSILIET